MNVFLISHIADPDGITPVILSKIIFNNFDYLLLEVNEVNTSISKLIDEKKFDNYDIIYITDLSMSEELYNRINDNTKLKDKIKVIDHHISNIFANKYSFVDVIDVNDEGLRESATSLYYKHLIKTYSNKTLHSNAIKFFVNLVREYDTWEWAKTNNMDAKKLANLFDIYGKEFFIEHYYKFLSESETFSFSEKELFLLEIEQQKMDHYIEEKKETVIPVTIDSYKAGIVFASQYRSELGNILSKHFIDRYDFIIIINIERSISYRGIKDVDLNKIASMFGGKGHLNASGSPLPDNIHEQIIKTIFDNKVNIIKCE